MITELLDPHSSAGEWDAMSHPGVPPERWTAEQLRHLLDELHAEFPSITIDARLRLHPDHPETGQATLLCTGEHLRGRYEIALQPRRDDQGVGYRIESNDQLLDLFEDGDDWNTYPRDGELDLHLPTLRDAVWACNEMIEAGLDHVEDYLAIHDRLQAEVNARSELAPTQAAELQAAHEAAELANALHAVEERLTATQRVAQFGTRTPLTDLHASIERTTSHRGDNHHGQTRL